MVQRKRNGREPQQKGQLVDRAFEQVDRQNITDERMVKNMDSEEEKIGRQLNRREKMM